VTRVGFYVLKAAEPGERLAVAMRLTEKAWSHGNRVFIHAVDEEQARNLDEQLWQFRPASFLPHGIIGEENSDLIGIGWGQEPGEHSDLLINLQLSIPGFFSRFGRVAEVVTQDAASLNALRKSWTFYRERGCQLEKHDL